MNSVKQMQLEMARATDVCVTDDRITVQLEDGRTLSVPILWSPLLNNATQAQRDNWELNGRGMGIHWPDLDEDLKIEHLLLGLHAVRNGE